MKDECEGVPIAEVVCIRPKIYTMLEENNKKNIKKARM